jgi:hypothetical protein
VLRYIGFIRGPLSACHPEPLVLNEVNGEGFAKRRNTPDSGHSRTHASAESNKILQAVEEERSNPPSVPPSQAWRETKRDSGFLLYPFSFDLVFMSDAVGIVVMVGLPFETAGLEQQL